MVEMILTDSPQDGQHLDFCPARQPRLLSRSVILSLIVFALSFGVLFVGPALALRMMAGAVEGTGPLAEFEARLPELRAAGVVTNVVLQQGLAPVVNGSATGPAYTGAKDTYMNQWLPDSNKNSETRLMLGQSGAYRPLVYFDLAAAGIPSDATVISAQLGIYCYARNVFSQMEAQAYQVYRHWEPGQATWKRATSSALWGAEGCNNTLTDRSPTAAVTRSVFVREAFHYFDITSVVQDWISSPSSNEGVVLIGPDPAVIYYYYSSEWSTDVERPQLIITWTIEVPTPTPSPSPTLTKTPGPTPTRTPSPTPTLTPAPGLLLDETSGCYSHSPPAGVWQVGTMGGYNGGYEYETTGWLTATARWGPCGSDPIPADGMYEVQAHWSVHSARPQSVPYEIHYNGGVATIYVDQTRNASGGTAPNFSSSGWYSLGVYPFRAGTSATTGEYVEVNTSSTGDTCADAVNWVPLPGVSGPPHAVAISADPTELPSDGSSTSSIVVTVTDRYGHPVDDGTMVGLDTTLGTLPYRYVEAEDASVTKLGTWLEYSGAGPSGGKLIYSNNFGDEAVWTFQGPAVSVIYTTNAGGGVADVIVDGLYVTTMNFAGPLQWQMERQLVTNLSPGMHTIRIRCAGTGWVWIDAFRSGAVTTDGVATASLVAPFLPGTATVRAVAIAAGFGGSALTWPSAQITVSFPGPMEVWVDDDYCSGCANDGHIWNYTAFDTVQGGVNGVLSGGIVHVLAGSYAGNVTVDKPVSLLGAGSSVVFVQGTNAPGSRGFYVNRADNVTIRGFNISQFERGIFLRGTGSGAGPRVFNAAITDNEFGNNNAGSDSYAVFGQYVYTSTICNNDVHSGYHGIYLEELYGTAICYDDIYYNQGFGIKINTGNDNSIDNCYIYENANLGIELAGTTQRNGVYGNTFRDLAWDGVLVNGSGSSTVDIGANVIERTNLTWLSPSGAPDTNHNLGAVVLIGTTDSTVYDNRISDVSNAEGNRGDASGVFLRNNTAPITIQGNLIQDCLGHGIHIPPGGGVATVHGNSIYGNGRFGLNNQLAANVHVEGNWWGCNTLTFGPSAPADIFNEPSASYSPPISVSLNTTPPAIYANGIETANVVATASGFGYNILDGTSITFTSDLNTVIFPTQTAFAGGQASATVLAGTIAGAATITGTVEPGRCGEPVTLTLLANPPHAVSIAADPIAIPNACDVLNNRSVVSFTVWDVYGNPVAGVPVTFTNAGPGFVFPETTTTVAGTGVATTTFTSNLATGLALVTGRTGITLTDSIIIEVTSGPPDTAVMTPDPGCPDQLPANGVATSLITVTMTDCTGNAPPNGTMVGLTTTLGSIVDYEYVEAESADVIKSPGWATGTSASASGGHFTYSSTPGASANWAFKGGAVSLIYQRYSGGGVIRVRVDSGTPRTIDTNGTPAAWVEEVIATNLSPVAPHQIEVSHYSGGAVRLDAFRSGAASTNGIVTAILRAPALNIVSPSEVHTATVHATTRLELVPSLVVTADVCFGQADVVWVDDDWAGLPDGTSITLPPAYGGGIVTIGSDAFDTIPKGVAAVVTGGTVRVLEGEYPRAVAGEPIVISRTMSLLGDGYAATTSIIGSGTGNGIRVRAGADNVTIDGFAIRDFDYGVWLEGLSGNYLQGLVFTNNAITGSVTGALTATYVSNGYFADSLFYDNDGFGFDLDTGDDNQILNNEIYENHSFGLRLFSSSATSTDNVVSYNTVHDVDGDGIRIGTNCANTEVSHNTVHTTNRVSASFNSGGIALRSTDNTTVEYNAVSNVGTAGGITNTAGIWVGGSDAGAVIQYNTTLNNHNDGILLDDFNASSPPEIHCNHIYGNAQYGLRNEVGLPPTVDAEGNWWGTNTPSVGTTPPKDIYRQATPNNVDVNPWIQLTLTPSASTVYAGSAPIAITAQACGGGCCVLDNTPISYTTNLGTLASSSGVMISGQHVVMFSPGTTAGVATITGTLPNNGVATTTVTILPLRPAFITMDADPRTIVVGTGMSAITATVRDIYSNPVEDGTTINFSSPLGFLVPSFNTTITGVATSTLYAGTIPGTATVRGSWGSVFGTVNVEILAGPPYTITSLYALPDAIPGDGVSTSLIVADVVDEYYNPVPDGTCVGFTTTAGSMIYSYVEAEGPYVGKDGSWTTPTHSEAWGGAYIRTSTAGDQAGWSFDGEAVSLRYRQRTGNGRMQVRVDGGVVQTIDTNGPDMWIEATMAGDLTAGVPHSVTVLCMDNLRVELDAFRSGASTVDGRAVGILTSQLLPPTTAVVWATGGGGTSPISTTTVTFLQPAEVWVDDDYCPSCLNDGHIWGYNAFSNIPNGVTAVQSAGTVHVLSGVYTIPVTINKPLYLDGAGSATTIIRSLTPDTGIGIRVRDDADGIMIEGFSIEDFGYGLWVDGRVSDPLNGITFTSNVITGCSTGGITATHVYNGVFADNTLMHNVGFGFDLNTGDENLIQNNRIHSLNGFGLRVFSSSGTSTGNTVLGNQIHDVSWDGIRIGAGAINTSVMSNTVHNTNSAFSSSGFNGGGIVLNSTLNTTVEYNAVSHVGAAGTLTDTAGVWVGGANSGGVIRHNSIVDNTNHGVLLTNFVIPPPVNCNHIYGNGGFGLWNYIASTTVNAEDNWWGHQPPPTTGPTPPRDIRRYTPSNVDWDPAIGLTLIPAQSTVTAGDPPIAITLTGCSFGCCLMDATPVQFETDLGGLGDPPGPSAWYDTSGGQAIAMFTPGPLAGTATITATVPNNGVVTTTVEIVAGAPFTVLVEALPPNIEVDSSTTIRVTVVDQFTNPIPAMTVHITTNLGAFNAAGTDTSTVGTTNVNGRVTKTFWSRPPVAGIATITATAGGVTGIGYVYIGVGPAKQCLIEAYPPAIPADGVSTSGISAVVLDTGGNPAPDGFFVGFTTTHGSMLYGYAEDSDVNQSPPGSWATISHAAASGGTYIETTSDGASVYWPFRGNGVSVIYRRAPPGGIADVYVDGGFVGSIVMSGTLTWRAEQVFTWSGSPTESHLLRLSHRTGTGRIWMDAFRSGMTTSGGEALALLTSEQSVVTATVAATAISRTHTSVPVLLPAFADVRFLPADLIITKTVTPADRVAVGQRVTFTLQYQNLGPITATNAYIDDHLQNGALDSSWLRDIFFSSTPITITPGLHYRWSLGSLAAGATGSIDFGGVVAEDRYWPAETVITNTAVIDSLTVDPRRRNNTSSITITIVPSAPLTMTLTAWPHSIPVGGDTSLLRAVVRDAYNNPIANGTPITFETSLGGFPAVQERVRYSSEGEAKLNLTSGPLAGTAYVTATVDSITAHTSVVFEPLGPQTITVTAHPDAIPVAGATSLIEALVVDEFGNRVANGTLVTFATTDGTIAPLVVPTVNGRATTVLTSGTAAVTATVSATSGSAVGTCTVRFLPGEPRVRIIAHPTSLAVGNNSRITVIARDLFGNPVLDGTVVTFTTSLGYFTDTMITMTLGSTVGGSAEVLLTSTEVGIAEVRGAVGEDSALVHVTFTAGEPYTIEILSVEPGVIQDCVGTALATVLVKDKYGNLVTDGTVVVFDVTPQGDVEPIDGGRTTAGVAQAIVSAGTVPGPGVVWAWPERYRTSVVDQYGVAFVVGPPDRIELYVEPRQLMVGGASAAVRARILDCGAYPVTDGTPVTFTITSGDGTLVPQTTTTASGWAYATLTSPDQVGSATIRVTAGDREANVVVEYVPGPACEIVLRADPWSIRADGASTSNISAEIRDCYGNNVADRTAVSFSTDKGLFGTASSYSTFTLGGRAGAVLTSSTEPGIARVLARAGGMQAETYVDFYFEPTPGAASRAYLPVIRKNSTR